MRCTRTLVSICPEVQWTLELLNRDGHAEVFVHLDNIPGDRSVGLPNGTRLSVIGREDDTYLVLHNGQQYGVKEYHCKILSHEVCGSAIQMDSTTPTHIQREAEPIRS